MHTRRHRVFIHRPRSISMFNGPADLSSNCMKPRFLRSARSASSSCFLSALVFVFLTTFAHAQTYTKLATLTPDIGKLPVGALVQGADGGFYGTALSGGLRGNG